MNLTFTDGILIASCVWFFIAVFALIRGLLYSLKIDRDVLSEYWDSSIKVGFTIAYFYANNPKHLEGLCNLYLDPGFLEAMKETIVEAEHDESNTGC